MQTYKFAAQSFHRKESSGVVQYQWVLFSDWTIQASTEYALLSFLEQHGTADCTSSKWTTYTMDLWIQTSMIGLQLQCSDGECWDIYRQLFTCTKCHAGDRNAHPASCSTLNEPKDTHAFFGILPAPHQRYKLGRLDVHFAVGAI